MKLLEFIVASTVLAVMPGPDILFVMTQSVVRGARAGISAALGLCSGLFVHTTLAALGISVLIAGSPALFGIIRYAGIAYLVYMGIRSLLRRNDAPAAETETPAGSAWKLYKTGVTMNLLNPKIILFFLALFPQFLDKQSFSPRTDIFILGATFALIAVTVFSSVALVAGWISSKTSVKSIPPRILAFVQAGVYWLIAGMFLFY